MEFTRLPFGGPSAFGSPPGVCRFGGPSVRCQPYTVQTPAFLRKVCKLLRSSAPKLSTFNKKSGDPIASREWICPP
jgi:hypothetical protein